MKLGGHLCASMGRSPANAQTQCQQVTIVGRQGVQAGTQRVHQHRQGAIAEGRGA